MKQTVEVPLDEWLAMHLRMGMAEGLLTGWLYSAPDEQEGARDVTRKFLENENG